jgi:aspartate/methionine/tyrosine aminotransferase
VFSSRIDANATPNRFTVTLHDLQQRGTSLIDLTESNPTRVGFNYPKELLSSLSDPKGLLYAPHPLGMMEARAAIAEDYRRRNVLVDAQQIVLTASTSESYSLLFKVLCDPGDEVLVPRPSYPLFEHLTRLEAVVAVPYDLEYIERWQVDVESVAKALTPRSRVMLAVHPNNPTGSFLQRDEFERVAQLCATRQVAIVVDEVFADFELTEGARDRAANTLKDPATLVFSLGGLSKSVGLPQVKLGWIAAAGPRDEIVTAMDRLELACDTYLSVSTSVQLAAPTLLRQGTSVRQEIQRRIVTNHQRLIAASIERPECRVLNADGGWYAVIQVPAIASEEDIVIDLLRGGVVTHPGYFFDFPREAFLIVSLLPPEPLFVAGIDRIFRHFDCSRAGR